MCMHFEQNYLYISDTFLITIYSIYITHILHIPWVSDLSPSLNQHQNEMNTTVKSG